MSVLMSETFAAALISAGLIEGRPDGIRRVLIDAQAGMLVRVYVEYLADDRWLDVGPLADGAEVITQPVSRSYYDIGTRPRNTGGSTGVEPT